MKQIFTTARWLIAPIAICFFATSANAQNRTVKLTVNVVSVANWKSEPVAGANVTLTPSTGGLALHRETGGDGSVTVDVPIGAAKFGEGWLSSEPSIQVAVEKDSQTGSSTVNIRTKEFKTTPVIEIVRTVTLNPPPAPLTATSVTRLMVRVVDERGSPISGASVNITRDTLGPEFQYGSSIQTGPDGVASTEIAIYSSGFKLKNPFTYASRLGAFGEGWLYAPTFDLEVRKESLSGKDSFKLIGGKTADGFRYPESVTRTVVLPRSVGANKEATINVAVDVQDEEHNTIGGATVVVWDTSLGNVTGRFAGVSGEDDGRATIPVVYGSLNEEESLPVEVSKTGYRQKKIFVDLKANQAGQTVFGGTAALEKNGPGGMKVTITVLNQKNNDPVGGARVVLDGGGNAYYSDTTGGTGVTTFDVAQSGTLKVEITHDDYLSFSGEIRVLQDQPKPVPFQLEPKANKTQGEDTIEVTVLGKDSTDEKSKPAPIKGAYVKAGTISAETDEGGVAPLSAAFAETQEVTVQANGYKTKTQNVRVNKILHMSAGSAKTTFILDPELSDSSPVRLQIEVRDVSGKPIPNALVELLTLSGERAGGDPTDAAGNYTFNSSEFEGDLSELRKGLLLKVVAKGYQLIERRSVPAEMLKPSTKTGEFIVQLDQDWSGLEKELAALEARVKAWSAERFAGVAKAGEDAFIDKALTTRKHAEQTGKEIEAAKEAFGIVTNPGGVTLTRCKKAAELKQDIELCEAEANQKAEEMKRLLDAAGNVAETCSAAGDADVIRANYKDAIKLIAQIGVRSKKAVKDRDELLKLAQETSASTKLLAELEAKLASIGEDKKTAEDNAGKAAEQYGRISDGVKGSNAKRNELYSDFATLKDKYNVNQVAPPAPIQTRLDAIENTLNPRDSLSNEGGKPKQVPESVASAVGVIEGVQGQAEKFIAHYRAGGCDIDTMDEVVNGLNTTLTNATGEIGLAGDIMTKATACENKLKDEVEVPDLLPLNDLEAMTRAADQVGMKFHAVATSATPPPKSQRLFGPQDPLAKAKAKRGDSLTIIVYQKLAEKNATPTPTPIVVSSATPTPTAADEYVDVPSVASAKDAGAMSKMLGDAGFTAVFHAATPKKKEDELKYAGQDPVGPMKKSEMQRRGNQVVVSINQTWQPPPTAQATPTPDTAIAGTMPKLRELTLEQAIALLPAGVRIGSDEIGDKPPADHPEKALTIFYQYPPVGQAVPPGTAVTITRYGSGESTVAASTPEPTSDSEPDSSTQSGPTDITNTTGGEFWKGKTPPAKKPTATKKTAPPPNKKKKTSDWWRKHGHDRSDYEVPNN